MDTNPFAPPTAVVADITPPQLQTPPTPFFPVSIRKLVVLSVCTLGIYEVYWFYKNWQLIKARELSRIYPAPRAVFAVFYCYQCFARVRDFGSSASTKARLAAGPLAAGWIITTLMQRLPDPFWLVSMFGVIFILPVQAFANQINSVTCPGHDPNSRFTTWNWVAVVFGSVAFVLACIGAFIP